MDTVDITIEILRFVLSFVFVVGTIVVAIHLAKNGTIEWWVAVCVAYVVGILDEKMFMSNI